MRVYGPKQSNEMAVLIEPLLNLHAQGVTSLSAPLLHFLHMRRTLLSCSLTLLSYYFVRKADRAPCASHPVVSQIVRMRKLMSSMHAVTDAGLLRAKDHLASVGARVVARNGGDQNTYAHGTMETAGGDGKEKKGEGKKTKVKAKPQSQGEQEDVFRGKFTQKKDWTKGKESKAVDVPVFPLLPSLKALKKTLVRASFVCGLFHLSLQGEQRSYIPVQTLYIYIYMAVHL